MSRRKRKPSPKGTPTPRREAQRALRRAAARDARSRDPHLTALYDLFAPPPKARS